MAPSVTKPRVSDGLKMRASVRMTRFLESWGAVKPFAHLQSREEFCTDAMVNGKGRCKVRDADVNGIDHSKMRIDLTTDK